MAFWDFNESRLIKIFVGFFNAAMLVKISAKTIKIVEK